MKFKFELNIGWLYPDLMSTYGDRGNIICLKKRCEWRNLIVNIRTIGIQSMVEELSTCDLIIGGGAQDRQQTLVVKDLIQYKAIKLKKLFDNGVPGLFVCGSPQLLGKYYMTGDGKKLEGVGIFDFVTKHFGHDKPRCIGNTVGEVIGCSTFAKATKDKQLSDISKRKTIVGFENHGGRTYLGKNCKPFAKVLRGYGNNGEDGFEGAVYKNIIACYYHGPFLSKNPHIADWLIQTALDVKYKRMIKLEPLDDELEWRAHDFMLKRMGVKDI
jgi:lipid II isoglutaminyl synthase (glutamine-hydrolysing)